MPDSESGLGKALAVPWTLSIPGGLGASRDSAIPFIEVRLAGAINIRSSVSRVTVEDNDRLIDKATIVLDDPHGSTADVPREGQTVRVAMGWGDDGPVLFDGVITRVQASAASSGLSSVIVTAFDPSWRMSQSNADSTDEAIRNPKTRNLPPGRLSALLEQIVSPYGIPVGIIRCEPDPEFTQQRPLRQVNQSDWELIQDLADRYHARAYVEYNDGAARFYFQPESTLLQGDPMGVLHHCRGFRQLVEFGYERIASGAAAQRTATTVDPETGDPVTASPPAQAPDAPVTPDADTGSRLSDVNPNLAEEYTQALQVVSASEETPAGQRPAQVAAGAPSDPALPEQVIRRDPTLALGYLGRGVACGTPMLRAKGKVTIHGIASWAEGDWYVRKAVHVYTRVIENTRDPRTQRPTTRDRSTYQTRFVATR